jgi:hypothetical protein
MGMRVTLLDEQLEQQFQRDGFVTINLLDQNQLEGLKNLIEDLNSHHRDASTEEKSSYKLSFFNDDLAFKKKVFASLSNFFQPLVDQYLKAYKPLIINIFDKEPGKGEVPVHQNWTFVDEDQYTSVSVWIPLVNVSRKNGTLEVVPGTHKALCKYRSPSLPWVFDELNDVLKEKYLQPFEIHAGQAAIIDDGILHWSSENKSNTVRTAVQLIMAPAEATTIHLVKPSDQHETLIYRVDPEFFMKYNMKDIPSGYEVIGKKPIHLSKLNERAFRQILPA